MAQHVRLAMLLVVLLAKEPIIAVVLMVNTTMEHLALRAMLHVRLAIPQVAFYVH